MTKKYRIVYDREGCIGAAACVAVSPDYWEIASDGKADLKGAKKNPDGLWELVLDEEKLKENFSGVLNSNKDAAESCPVSVIKIFDLETGKQIV